jgi:membrane-bound ClpP family serine protease
MEFVGMPILQILLVSTILLSLLAEIKTGGMGIGALLGLVAAGVFFGGQYVRGLVSFYHIAVFMAGVVCILIEILTPVTGLFAGIGVAALLYSLILALGGDLNAVYMMGIAAVLAILVFAVIVRKLPASKLWKKIVLTDKPAAKDGFVSSDDKRGLLGKEGIVVNGLRPAGKALIEDATIDVISEGMFLAKGEKIRVIKVQGSRVVVKKEE